MSMLNTYLLLEPNPVPSLNTVKLSGEIDPLLPCLECSPLSAHRERFPFDQKFRFEFLEIFTGEWE